MRVHLHNPAGLCTLRDARINGFSHINLTKLDVLSGLAEIQVGVAYKLPDGRLLPSVPSDIPTLEAVEVRRRPHR
jgi:adenylosuccinate synthase